MDEGVIITQLHGKTYPGKLTGNVLVTCIVAAMGGGVTSMPSFLEKFFQEVYRKLELHDSTNQYGKFNSEKLTLFTSSLYLVVLVASWDASYSTISGGRRLSMLFGGTLFLAGAIVNAGAKNLAILYIGHAILDAGIGFANQSVLVYLSEMAPDKWLGGLNMGFQLFIAVGILIANVVNYFFEKKWHVNGWRMCLRGAVVSGLIFMLGSFFLPDTPNSLIERGKTDEAKRRLQKICGIEDVDEEFQDLIMSSEESRKVKHPWVNIMQRRSMP